MIPNLHLRPRFRTLHLLQLILHKQRVKVQPVREDVQADVVATDGEGVVGEGVLAFGGYADLF